LSQKKRAQTIANKLAAKKQRSEQRRLTAARTGDDDADEEEDEIAEEQSETLELQSSEIFVMPKAEPRKTRSAAAAAAEKATSENEGSCKQTDVVLLNQLHRSSWIGTVVSVAVGNDRIIGRAVSLGRSGLVSVRTFAGLKNSRAQFLQIVFADSDEYRQFEAIEKEMLEMRPEIQVSLQNGATLEPQMNVKEVDNGENSQLDILPDTAFADCDEVNASNSDLSLNMFEDFVEDIEMYDDSVFEPSGATNSMSIGSYSSAAASQRSISENRYLKPVDDSSVVRNAEESGSRTKYMTIVADDGEIFTVIDSRDSATSSCEDPNYEATQDASHSATSERKGHPGKHGHPYPGDRKHSHPYPGAAPPLGVPVTVRYLAGKRSDPKRHSHPYPGQVAHLDIQRSTKVRFQDSSEVSRTKQPDLTKTLSQERKEDSAEVRYGIVEVRSASQSQTESQGPKSQPRSIPFPTNNVRDPRIRRMQQMAASSVESEQKTREVGNSLPPPTVNSSSQRALNSRPSALIVANASFIAKPTIVDMTGAISLPNAVIMEPSPRVATELLSAPVLPILSERRSLDKGFTGGAGPVLQASYHDIVSASLATTAPYSHVLESEPWVDADYHHYNASACRQDLVVGQHSYRGEPVNRLLAPMLRPTLQVEAQIAPGLSDTLDEEVDEIGPSTHDHIPVSKILPQDIVSVTVNKLESKSAVEDGEVLEEAELYVPPVQEQKQPLIICSSPKRSRIDVAPAKSLSTTSPKYVPTQLSSVTDASATPSRKSLPEEATERSVSNEICKFFNVGACKFGDKCRNIHIRKEEPKAPKQRIEVVTSSSAPPPKRTSRIVTVDADEGIPSAKRPLQRQAATVPPEYRAPISVSSHPVELRSAPTLFADQRSSFHYQEAVAYVRTQDTGPLHVFDERRYCEYSDSSLGRLGRPPLYKECDPLPQSLHPDSIHPSAYYPDSTAIHHGTNYYPTPQLIRYAPMDLPPHQHPLLQRIVYSPQEVRVQQHQQPDASLYDGNHDDYRHPNSHGRPSDYGRPRDYGPPRDHSHMSR
jgi:hypothetical protein